MRSRTVTTLFALCLWALPAAVAQTPKELVQQAVDTELAANRNDHSHWRYRQEEKFPQQAVFLVVETAQGSVKEKVEQDGHPLTPEQAAAEAKRVENFVHDPSQQAKQRRDGQHDDESAQKLLRMLPLAFVWKEAGSTAESITLSYTPDPNFQPAGMEARVMSTMGGEMTIDRRQHRIRSFRGSLTQDVSIGYGLLGKLRQGGTFDVERRELAPGFWQITETHIHIDGRALLFKTIGQQQDEVNSGHMRVPDATTLEQAAALLTEMQGRSRSADVARYAHP